MGIGWLWHFTNAGNSDTLRAGNEDRAAAFYARWRALHRLAASPTRRLRDVWLEGRSARELDALTDDVLGDVGLRRDVDGSVVPAPREWNRLQGPTIDAFPSTCHQTPPRAGRDGADLRERTSPLLSSGRSGTVPRHDEYGQRAA